MGGSTDGRILLFEVIIFVIILVLLILIVLFIYISKKKDDDENEKDVILNSKDIEEKPKETIGSDFGKR